MNKIRQYRYTHFSSTLCHFPMTKKEKNSFFDLVTQLWPWCSSSDHTDSVKWLTRTRVALMVILLRTSALARHPAHRVLALCAPLAPPPPAPPAPPHPGSSRCDPRLLSSWSSPSLCGESLHLSLHAPLPPRLRFTSVYFFYLCYFFPFVKH